MPKLIRAKEIHCENRALFQAVKVFFELCANQIWFFITFYPSENHSTTNQIVIGTESNVNILADNGKCLCDDFSRRHKRQFFFNFCDCFTTFTMQCFRSRYTSVTTRSNKIISNCPPECNQSHLLKLSLHHVEYPMIFSHNSEFFTL